MANFSTIFAPDGSGDADIAPPPPPVLTPEGDPPPTGPDPSQPDDPQGGLMGSPSSDMPDDGTI